MRTLIMCLVTMMPTVIWANSESCAEAPFCKHGDIQQEQPDSAFPTSVNSQITDLRDASADIQGEPDFEALVSEQITD
ncbi:MAG: hypothetical protein ACRBB0_01980 [Pelagimonas sp.]|uniref:hypothetical protein n=1 Tax=Pelagimonas sp. TaxID=2073170 RepID=UPI003D6A6D42